MAHLTQEELYDLAQVFVAQQVMTQTQEAHLSHIGSCESCYGLLRATMAVLEAAEHGPELAMYRPVRQERADSAVIRIVVLDTRGILEQLGAIDSQWMFDQPLFLAGARSAGEGGAEQAVLEDIDDSDTYLSYDPVTRVLVIQMAAESEPRARLRLPGGEEREIRFEKREHLYWAEIHGLETGEYQLLLEKE